jgi:hypothetical protein
MKNTWAVRVIVPEMFDGIPGVDSLWVGSVERFRYDDLWVYAVCDRVTGEVEERCLDAWAEAVDALVEGGHVDPTKMALYWGGAIERSNTKQMLNIETLAECFWERP